MMVNAMDVALTATVVQGIRSRVLFDLASMGQLDSDLRPSFLFLIDCARMPAKALSILSDPVTPASR